jgi:hypothetical protein
MADYGTRAAAKLPVIGFLNGESAAPYASRLVAFRDGLSESGLIENKNVTIEYSFAEGKYDRLRALASDLARRQVADSRDRWFAAGGEGRDHNNSDYFRGGR